MSSKKEQLVSSIIEDLQANEFESREYIYDLVREALMTRTNADLQQIINGD